MVLVLVRSWGGEHGHGYRQDRDRDRFGSRSSAMVGDEESVTSSSIPSIPSHQHQDQTPPTHAIHL
jgi:hypothetical protein